MAQHPPESRRRAAPGSFQANGSALRHELNIRGLTVEQFARMSGLHPRTILRALNGEPVWQRSALKMDAALARAAVLPNLAKLAKPAEASA